MKKAILCLALVLGSPFLLPAQYLGSDGRGDVSTEHLNVTLSDEHNCNNLPISSNSLQQNYPNPFSSVTIFKFSISEAGDVKIVVYDILGHEVQTLFNGSLKPGMHEVSFDGSSEKSGVYFYKIISGDYSETRKMILQK
jgi:hypothetical protein